MNSHIATSPRHRHSLWCRKEGACLRGVSTGDQGHGSTISDPEWTHGQTSGWSCIFAVRKEVPHDRSSPESKKRTKAGVREVRSESNGVGHSSVSLSRLYSRRPGRCFGPVVWVGIWLSGLRRALNYLTFAGDDCDDFQLSASQRLDIALPCQTAKQKKALGHSNRLPRPKRGSHP